MDITILLAGLKQHYLGWGMVFALLTAFELLNPREHQSLRLRLQGAGFWTLLLALSFVAMVTLGLLWQALGVRPLFAVPSMQALVGGPWAAAILGAVLAAVIHDFFFYWCHRIQHRWLWRWHAVHHSIEELNAVNSYHHPSEAAVALLLLQIPASLLVSIEHPASTIMGVLLACHVVWIHSPTRITLGPLRVLIVDNRFHRIHHSVEPRHFGTNFGAFTTIWDRLFGTCHMPVRDEWPQVGIAEARQPRSFGAWMGQPWQVKHQPGAAEGNPVPAGLDPLPDSAAA
ncbi:sterol desaturase family protein [Sphingomonas koreensis]